MSDTDQTQDQGAAAPAAAPQRKVRTPGRAAAPAAPLAAADAAEMPEDTPNAIDVDAKTIDGPVLTRQGWVCPDMTGREHRGIR